MVETRNNRFEHKRCYFPTWSQAPCKTVDLPPKLNSYGRATCSIVFEDEIDAPTINSHGREPHVLSFPKTKSIGTCSYKIGALSLACRLGMAMCMHLNSQALSLTTMITVPLARRFLFFFFFTEIGRKIPYCIYIYIYSKNKKESYQRIITRKRKMYHKRLWNQLFMCSL